MDMMSRADSMIRALGGLLRPLPAIGTFGASVQKGDVPPALKLDRSRHRAQGGSPYTRTRQRESLLQSERVHPGRKMAGLHDAGRDLGARSLEPGIKNSGAGPGQNSRGR